MGALAQRKRERLKLVKQLRGLWASSGVKVEDQDKFLLRNDNVLTITFQRIQRELDLQKSISESQRKVSSYYPAIRVPLRPSLLQELTPRERF